MMHPDTGLAYIGPEKGFGVIARKSIPKGTILYVRDRLDVLIPPNDPAGDDPLYAKILLTYAYTEPDGTRVICWDHGKFMNHCCDPNTLSTGYGFEIVIRDIGPGEEITDHYALLNLEFEMDLNCSRPGCLGKIKPGDLGQLAPKLDQKIKEALQHLEGVDQPLLRLVDDRTRKELKDYLGSGKGYRTVLSLQSPSVIEQASQSF